MDPLSITASIIAIIQLTGKIVQYLSSVEDASKECRKCTIEASNLLSLLVNVRYRLEQGEPSDPCFTAVRALAVTNGPLDQYKSALEQLQSKVAAVDGIHKIKRALVWNFSKAEVADILARMERLKSLIGLALEMDHFKLSQEIQTRVDSIHSRNQAIQNDTNFIRNILPTLQTGIIAVQVTQNLRQYHEVIEWLSSADFPAQQHDLITRRQEGTGQWFLDSPMFINWLQGSHKTLFCPGIPGSGKTMMIATAIDHLCKKARNNDIGVAYVYCNYKVQDQNAYSLLSSLLKPLVLSRFTIPEPVFQLYDYHSMQKTKPSLDEIFETLSAVCMSFPQVYIMVDALDELDDCADQNGAQNGFLTKLRALQQKTDLSLMVTSRFIHGIEQEFRSSPRLEVRASNEDVNRFVTGQIPRLPRCIRNDMELQGLLQEKIVEAVDGMFLLARLHVDSLLDKRTKTKAKLTLQNLSKGSAALDEAYGKAIKRIDGQLSEDRLLARRVLSWIIHAERQLTIAELCHALAVELHDKELDLDNIPDIEDLVSVCAGLVIVDEDSNVIRLVHLTAQEYLERMQESLSPTAQQELGLTCLTYLSFDEFRSGSCASEKEFERRLEEYVFLDYAARH